MKIKKRNKKINILDIYISESISFTLYKERISSFIKTELYLYENKK